MIVQADNVWKRFGRFDALRGLSFGVPEGSTFALIGANGAGKTTTINCSARPRQEGDRVAGGAVLVDLG